MNQLILGDNFEAMRNMPSESVDLIYLDPPFFSNRNYEIIWGDEGEIRSFRDRWSGGIDQYISWLKERVIEMHRLLKPTGSIYLHCDWHANAYIRVYILDKIFGENNFKGDIVWQRTFAHNDAINRLPILKDTIWYYSKTEKKFTYNPIYIEYSEKYKDNAFNRKDKFGKYQLITITGPGINKNDEEWRGHHPNKVGRHWAVPQKAIKKYLDKEEINSKTTNEKLEFLFQKGLIVFSKNNVPRLKSYLDEGKGTLLGEIWTDISNVSSQSNERIGYPTQKPVALLERIIKASSNEGDIVMDPFLGGGTTVVVADKLNRQWIGIDQSVQAIKISEMRLFSQRTLFSAPFVVILHKYDYDTLRYKEAFSFQEWIVEQFGGNYNPKKTGDFGIDGFTKDRTPIQVKRSDDIGRNVIDNFKSAVERVDKKLYEKNKNEHKEVGYILAFSFGKGAIQEVARLKNEEGIIIKLVRVDEIVPIAKKPKLIISFEDLGVDSKGNREIKFKASAESDIGIEFFAWDWDYDEKANLFKPEVYRDKDGVQIKKFAPGDYTIGCKVIDNDGMESVEIIRLKINGVVKID